jgi:hypothetical protein
MSNRNLDSLVDALYEISAAVLCDQFGDERAADRYLCAARDRLATIPRCRMRCGSHRWSRCRRHDGAVVGPSAQR